MKKIILLFILLIRMQLQAEETNFFENNSSEANNIGLVDDLDEPIEGAPINDYVIGLGFMALGIGIYGLKERKMLKQ